MRIPILLQRHSADLKTIEIDTVLREVRIIYLDNEPERRQYSESEFKDCTIVFTVETSK